MSTFFLVWGLFDDLSWFLFQKSDLMKPNQWGYLTINGLEWGQLQTTINQFELRKYQNKKYTLFKVMLEPEFISMILLHEIEYAHGSINVWTVSFRMQSHAYLIAFAIHNFFTCVLRAIIFLQYPRKYLHILGDMNGWKMDCGNCATCRHNNKILSALCISTVVCAYSMLNHVIFARQNVYCHKLRRKMPIKQCEIE